MSVATDHLVANPTAPQGLEDTSLSSERGTAAGRQHHPFVSSSYGIDGHGDTAATATDPDEAAADAALEARLHAEGAAEALHDILAGQRQAQQQAAGAGIAAGIAADARAMRYAPPRAGRGAASAGAGSYNDHPTGGTSSYHYYSHTHGEQPARDEPMGRGRLGYGTAQSSMPSALHSTSHSDGGLGGPASDRRRDHRPPSLWAPAEPQSQQAPYQQRGLPNSEKRWGSAAEGPGMAETLLRHRSATNGGGDLLTSSSSHSTNNTNNTTAQVGVTRVSSAATTHAGAAGGAAAAPAAFPQSRVRAYFGEAPWESLHARPIAAVGALATAFIMLCTYIMQYYVLAVKDHVGFFAMGSYVCFSSYFVVYYFLEQYSTSFHKISEDKKFYTISNILKASMLAAITPFAVLHLYRIIVHDEWDTNTLRNLGCVYAIPDFVAMLVVRRMATTTIFHHVCVVLFNYYSVQNDYGRENVCRLIVVYAAFSTFAYVVNMLLASRFLGVSSRVSQGLSFVALCVYVLCCAINWAWQAHYLRKLIASHDHWSIYVYMILICFVMWDDIVLNRWLLHNFRNTGGASPSRWFAFGGRSNGRAGRG